MCNMAGYVGKKRAAEVLIDMMLREEGFAGGYYTGIATLDNGKITAEKRVGDTQRLLSLTRAASLMGNVGIMHSRSESCEGDEWAHPFFGYNGDEREIAYIANGDLGFFKPAEEARDAIANSLYDEGYDMRTHMLRKNRIIHPKLADGCDVHVSDVMCQLIYKNIKNGLSPVCAIERAYCEMPGEIAGLMVLPSVENGILWARISMPIYIAFAPHGVYVASTALAFPDDAGTPILLPANSCGIIYADSYTVKNFDNPPASVAAIDAAVLRKAYARVSDNLRSGERIFDDLYVNLDDLFASADVYPREPLAYEIMQALNKEGKLARRITKVKGVEPEIEAPQIRMWLA